MIGIGLPSAVNVEQDTFKRVEHAFGIGSDGRKYSYKAGSKYGATF